MSLNNCISLQRKRKIDFEEIDEYKHGEDPDQDEGMLEVDPSMVHNAIRQLPPKGRSVLVLRALEGYSHKEIAEVLDISVSTSKTQYSRALSLLNKQLKDKVYVS